MTQGIYRGYPHTENEINVVDVSRQTRYSERAKRFQEVRTVKLYGEVIGSTTADILSSMQAIENAYSQDGGDFKYMQDSTTLYSLLNSGDCVSGVRVIQRPSFPDSDGAQFVTTRGFSVTLQATYDTCEDDLVSWQESIETIGTGGPQFFIVETGVLPIAFYTALRTAQYYQQTGSAVGYTDYPNPPGPINPAGEFETRRRIRRISGRQQGNGLRFFTTSWSYYMGRDVGTFGNVDYRPTSK